jgi:hypothetical protein
MDAMQTDKVIMEGLVKDREEAANLRDEINKDFFYIRQKNLFQRRDFLKHITLISAAILGLSGLFIDKPIIKIYFIIGIALHFIIIFLIFSYLRETLDKEDAVLQVEQDNYNKILEEKIGLIDEYLSRERLTKEAYGEYRSRLISSESAKKITEKNLELDKQRKNRKNQSLDYFKEIIVFLFSTASFFILISLTKQTLNFYAILIIIIFFLILSFSSPSLFMLKKLDRLMRFLKKENS